MMTPEDRTRWACWFANCADEADDLNDAEKRGLRIAATHLLEDWVANQVADIAVDECIGRRLAESLEARLDAEMDGAR